jgi:flagellar export protein FliJ
MAEQPGPLATLLRVRRRMEDIKARALAREQREAARLDAERQAMVAEQRRTLDAARVAVGEMFDASEVRRHYQYERYLARCVDAKDAQIRAQARVVAQRRDELTEAMKDRKKIEKLRERKLRVFFQMQRKQEQMLLDEVAVNLAARRMDEETAR